MPIYLRLLPTVLVVSFQLVVVHAVPGHLLGRPQEGLEAPSPLVTLTQLVAGENRRSLI